MAKTTIRSLLTIKVIASTKPSGMSSIVARRSASSLISVHHYPSPSGLAIICRRNESSFRRTKQRLRVRPDTSFTPSPKSARQDHIIFNPPSSSPSVYHTPLKFIPPEDKRRDLLSAIRTDTATPQLPPVVREPYQKQYPLTSEDITEVCRLRMMDPELWTRDRLAKQFKCSSLFIGIVCEASRERKQQQVKALEDIKFRWGLRRRTAREDRMRRRESWGRGE
ncbi:MAG: hypothetical protein M1840_004392 [Geoglossum simile]|nr:MAG: hypothetical protein M1840_004392 [Geoglossum simile]